MSRPRPQPPRKSDTTRPILICGVNPAREALRTTTLPITELLTARDDPRVEALAELARKRGIAVRDEAREALTALAGHAHHQGVVLVAGEFPYADLELLLEKDLPERDPLILLDSIQDPQNLGALMRSACFLGAKAIILPRDRSVGVTSTVVKIAAGAAAYLPVVAVTNLRRAIDRLKSVGYWIVGLDVRGGQSIYTVDLRIPVALVVGNEQKGLRPFIAKGCDFLAYIPAGGPLESLNAATAGAVVLSEVFRQRSESSKPSP